MAVELWLARHGQAAFATDDYDRLTDLGWRQARWLGEHLAAQGRTFDVIAAGRLRRQQETAAAFCEALGGVVRTVEGFEEYDADAILAAAGARIARADDRREHFRRLREALVAWSEDRLVDTPETWTGFNDRVRGAIDALAGEPATDGAPKRVLVATSGGVIGLVVSQALGLGAAKMIELNLQARNTGVTRLVVTRRATYLNMFNAVPHLERADRADAETYS